MTRAWPLVVIGGGPAGIAAATEAARAGLPCLLVDEAPRLGGQIYRQLPEPFRAKDPRRLGRDHARGARLRAALPDTVRVRSGTAVIDIVDGRCVVCTSADGTEQVLAERLVIATGAYDRGVPFPGWTLPGVMTAGGTQALLKTMRIRPGERALVSGTGPLLMVVAGQLHHAGVDVVAVLEAGRSAYTAGTVARSWRQWGLLRDGARYRLDLIRAGIPVRYHHSVVAAYGDESVTGAGYAPVDPVTWAPDRTRERRAEVDLVVVGYGFVPNVELYELAGCRTVYEDRLGGWVPLRDATMQTSLPGVFAAGDGAGVAGALAAVDEGRIAGITAAEQAGALSTVDAARRRRGPARRLAALAPVRAVLDEISCPRPGLADLATDDTPMCRCEEVTRAQVQAALAEGARDLQAVKLLTRLGMGACQGRTCAAPAALLCGSPAAAGRINPRPPVKPVTLAELARTRGGEPCASSSLVAE